MSATAASGRPATSATKPAAPRARGFSGLGRSGFAIVALVSLITSLNTTAKNLVTLPVHEWFLGLVEDFAFHALIGVTILLAAVWARNRFPVRGPRQYAVAFAAVTIATTAILLLLHGLQTAGTFGAEHENWVTELVLVIGTDVVRFAFVGLVITSTWLYVRTESEHAAALEQCAVDAARMDEQTAQARLQMLEAQIEPHFLFNTLANVKRLYETDRTSGARMLRNLKDYLAIALPQMRAGDSTLEREIDHARAYLEIQQIRMGRRLRYAIDLPDALRNAHMPSLMVLTLVENAVKHGLGPLPEGGRIDIRASLVDSAVRVQVADSGLGFVKSGGVGTGLANIRARLSTRFGKAASVSLAINAPRGVVATIVVPHAPAPTAAGR